MTNKKDRIAIRLSSSLKQRLEEEARTNNKNFSEFIRLKLKSKILYEPHLQIDKDLKIPLELLGKAKMIFEEEKL